MATEASSAALAGTSPIDASSGKQQRHRLNRDGTANYTDRLDEHGIAPSVESRGDA